MKLLHLLLFTCVAFTASAAEDLTWSALVSQRDLWPAEFTVNRALRFKQGGSVEAGQKLTVVEIQETRVLATTLDGRLKLAVKPEDTDILQRAAGKSARLTPAQRALPPAAVLQRRELWPYRVTLTDSLDLGGGKGLRRGEKVVLMDVENGRLIVGSERLNTSVDVDVNQTDLMMQARQYAQKESAVPGRFVEELEGKLSNPNTGAPATLEGGSALRYLMFYRGAGWCAPCREFSPSLMRFYQQMKPAHPEFELVFISDDKTPAELRKYAKEVGFAWPTVASNRYRELNLINPLFGQTIPHLVVTDRFGKVLIDSNHTERAAALKEFEALLKKTSVAK